MASPESFDVYLETGSKRVFAGALEWPGWCRSARDADGALQALLDYAPRYAKALRRRRFPFSPPKDRSAFEVVERLKGNATTDFGAPGQIPKFDEGKVGGPEMQRLQSALQASWSAFDAAVRAGTGKNLRTGPRGGGRDLEKMVRHVLEADAGYLRAIGVKESVDPKAELQAELARVRKVILEAMSELTGVEPVRTGPRGGARWPPRFFVRRSSWHVLDHAWEIEDRIEG